MGWIVGYVIGAIVVVVVVAVLLLMIRGARKAADQAEAIVAQLHLARDRSSGLWDVAGTVGGARRITTAAAAARQHLEGGGSR